MSMTRSAILYAKVVHLLDGKGLSLNVICEQSGLSRTTVSRFVQALREFKMAYVCGWGPDQFGRRSVPLFALGNEPDAQRPRFTLDELNERKRLRRKMHLPLTGKMTPWQETQPS